MMVVIDDLILGTFLVDHVCCNNTEITVNVNVIHIHMPAAAST